LQRRNCKSSRCFFAINSAAREPRAIALAGEAEALDLGLVLVDQIGEAGERAERRRRAQIGKHIVAADPALASAASLDAPDGPHIPVVQGGIVWRWLFTED